MATSTSLNLRAVLKTAIARSGMDVPARVVSGLTPSAKALFVAGAAQARPHGAVLYVVPSDGDLDQACADVAFFFSALEGLTPTAAERAVVAFPSHEIDPYRGLAPHVGVTSARARALHGLARGTARIVVASAAALLPRVTAPARLIAASLELKPGQDVAPIDLAELLVDAGFTREDPADEHGEFAIRGGIVDIFPAGETHPVRLEFIGDTIESLRTYDPATQRSIAPIDQIAVVRCGTCSARPSAYVHGPDSIGARRSSTTWRRPGTRACSCPKPTRSRPTPSSRSSSFSTVMTSAEPERAGRTAVGSFADWDFVQRRLEQSTHLAELGLDDDAVGGEGSRGTPLDALPPIPFAVNRLWKCAASRRLGCRHPAPPRRGRDDAVRGGDAGRAERTIELLKEYDVFAVPVERAEDARYAAVLVAVGALSRGFRLPDAALQVYAEADVFEEERARPSGADLPPRRFCRICAISRSATSSCTSTTASACSSV